MPPRQAQPQTPPRPRLAVSPFANAHPFLRAVLSSCYNRTWPWIYAAMAHNTLFGTSSHTRKTLVLSLALAVWLAKPTLIIAEVVYGLRAVELGVAVEEGEE